MAKLIASKPLVYATRQLKAGDEFEATARDARVLKAIRKATDAPEKPQKKPEPEITPLAAARAEYEVVFGKRPFMGWEESTIRQKIAKHEAEEEEG